VERVGSGVFLAFFNPNPKIRSYLRSSEGGDWVQGASRERKVEALFGIIRYLNNTSLKQDGTFGYK
jgi:hypothetical protein